MACTASRITYEKLGVLVTDFPAYKEAGTTSGQLIRVQNMNFGFQHPAIDVKEIGSDELVQNVTQKDGESPIIRQPEVSCEIEYLFSSGENERAIGFYTYSDGSVFKNYFEAETSDDISIIGVSANEGNITDLNFVDTEDFSGYNVIGVGNCFLTQYSYNAQVGSLPTASVSYAASNLKFDLYDPNNAPTLPSIKLGVDNIFSEEKIYLNSNSFNPEVVDGANAIMPGDMIIKITKTAGEYGGAPVESVDAAIQSISVNMPIPRQDIYGFGSNYVFGRKLKLPIIASASINMIVREYATGQIESFFEEGSKYDILIKHTDRYHHSGKLELASVINNMAIDNAQLRSQSFSNQIGGQSTVSTNFNFGISSAKGLRIYQV
jgi:hypothetical protein